MGSAIDIHSPVFAMEEKRIKENVCGKRMIGSVIDKVFLKRKFIFGADALICSLCVCVKAYGRYFLENMNLL